MFTVPVCTSPGVSAEFLDIFPRKPTGWQLYFDKKCCFLLWPAESVAVVWGGGKARSSPRFTHQCCCPWVSRSPTAIPTLPFPSTHTCSRARGMLQIGSSIIYFLCSVANPTQLELKQATWIAEGSQALPSPLATGSFACEGTHEELSYSDTYIFKLSCY